MRHQIRLFSHLTINASKETWLITQWRGWGGGWGEGACREARGGSCHKSQRLKIYNHKSQTFQKLQSQSHRLAQRILKSQVTDKLFCKFTDHRVFNSAITDHRQYLFRKSRTYFQPFHKSQTLKKKTITCHRNTSCPSPHAHPPWNKGKFWIQCVDRQSELNLLWGLMPSGLFFNEKTHFIIVTNSYR